MKSIEFLAALGLTLAAGALSADEQRRHTVIYEGQTTEVASPAEQAADLWLTLPDLTRATKYELKPEGVCTQKLCFPIPEGRKDEFIRQRSGATWFNLSAFARLVKQPAAHDAKNAIWYFGPRPEEQNSYLTSLIAPDFTLPDIHGKQHSLSDFRGKKVLLITWASW
jgi:hypothetical protein